MSPIPALDGPALSFQGASVGPGDEESAGRRWGLPDGGSFGTG
jgi:hypothetical protein